MNVRHTLAAAALTGLAAIPLAGCETSRPSAVAGTNAQIELDASSDQIVVGETVTFVARTKDTYGRDAKVEWNATSGDLKTEQNGRIARVTFDEVGTYTVRASLMVDGDNVAQDLEEIRVVALR
ncbi:MAG: PKD domain-containing protein [Phycisphaerales bacterium]